jgi:hypothetical protein
MLELRNEANFPGCMHVSISLINKWLYCVLCHFDTWLRFAGLGSFWGIERAMGGGLWRNLSRPVRRGVLVCLRLGFHVKGGFGRV